MDARRRYFPRRCSKKALVPAAQRRTGDRKSTRLNSSHSQISYAVFCLKKKKNINSPRTPPLLSPNLAPPLLCLTQSPQDRRNSELPLIYYQTLSITPRDR